jgi:hypothetical protein
MDFAVGIWHQSLAMPIVQFELSTRAPSRWGGSCDTIFSVGMRCVINGWQRAKAGIDCKASLPKAR